MAATVTLVAVGSRGDVEPYVALAERLARSGYETVVATHDRFRPLVEAVGAGHRTMAEDPRALMATPEVRRWQRSGADVVRIVGRLRAVAGPRLRRYLASCVEAVQGADLVLFSALGVGAFHVAEAYDIPAWPAFLQPTSPTGAFPSPFVPPGVRRLGPWANRLSHRLVEVAAWRAFAPEVQRFRAELGLPPLPWTGPAAVVRRRGSPHLFGIGKVVVAAPPDWPPSHRITGYWRRSATCDLPEEVAAWLDAGPPPVYVGFGSRRHEDPTAVTDAVVTAVRELGRRLVLQPGWGGLDPERARERLGGDVLVVDEVDHDRLFPRCVAVVHHGGAGTTAAGLCAGVPAVVVPSFADQFFWAWRVEELGAGPTAIPLRRLDGDHLAARLAEAVEQGYRRRAAQVAARLRDEDGPGEVVAAVDTALGGVGDVDPVP